MLICFCFIGSSVSQVVSKYPKYEIVNGDTIFQFNINQTRKITEISKSYDVCDEMLVVYIQKDSLQQKAIENLKEEIVNYKILVSNLEKVVENDKLIIKNMETVNLLLEDSNKQLRKQLKIQKFWKIMGFATTGVAVGVVIILLAK